MKKSVVTLFVLSLFASSAAWADIYMTGLTVPQTITNPVSGFNVTYNLNGLKYGSATAQLRFYISASQNGSTGVALLYSSQITLNGYGYGPYGAPSGTRSTFIAPYNGMPASTQTLLQNIANACAPQTWYILGEVDWGSYAPASTVMGTAKQPDYYFTGGTLSPSVIQPGGSTNISFDVYTRCPANSGSRVGIYLADQNYQLLSFIGGVSIGAGAGTSSLPPSTITFSPYIPTGTYNIVLLADMDGVVAESNESNNGGSFRLDVAWSATGAPTADEGKAQPLVELPIDASRLDGLKSGAADGSGAYELQFNATEAYSNEF
jgi:hypothetical protein